MSIGMIFLLVLTLLILFGVLQRVLDRMALTDRQALILVAAIFIVEYLRSKDTATAWASTLQALKAFGWTIAIELIAALTSATAWGIGVALAATGN